MLLSGLLYALLSLSDQLLLSFALVFASVLHDFISLTEGNMRLGKETKTGQREYWESIKRTLFPSWHGTLGWTSFSNALADSS